MEPERPTGGGSLPSGREQLGFHRPAEVATTLCLYVSECACVSVCAYAGWCWKMAWAQGMPVSDQKSLVDCEFPQEEYKCNWISKMLAVGLVLTPGRRREARGRGLGLVLGIEPGDSSQQ